MITSFWHSHTLVHLQMLLVWSNSNTFWKLMFPSSIFCCPISYVHDRQIHTCIHVTLSARPKEFFDPVGNLKENKDISAAFSSWRFPQTYCGTHVSQTIKDSMNCSRRKGRNAELWHSLRLHLLSAVRGTGVVRTREVHVEAPSPFCWALIEHGLAFSHLYFYDRDQKELSRLF